MPQSCSLQNGVWLETQLKAAGGEVLSAPRNTAGLSHALELAWRYNWRTAAIKVTHDIVQGGNNVQYASNTPLTWTTSFLRVKYGAPNRNDAKPISIGNQTGQAIIDCTSVEVFDIWKNRYVAMPGGLQLTLQVIP